MSSTTNNSDRWADADPPVRVVGVTKRYGQVVACDEVDLTLRRGEIHGVLGENGAGKSTLMNILIGLVHPDSGQVLIDGKSSIVTDPIDAANKGIGMVHQHFSVVDALTVWENVALGDRAKLDPSSIRNEIGDLSQHYGLEIDPNAVVGSLTAGLRQRVEIIKCLRRNPRVVILDEPTSVLTPQESEQLFGGLRRAVEDEGMAIVLVSHKLDEILHATDLVTIMRKGKVIATSATSEVNALSLAADMVGRPVSLRSSQMSLAASETSASSSSAATEVVGAASSAHENREVALQLEGVTVRGDDGRILLDGLDLEVREGEIVGVAGVEGNGQRTVGDLLSSLVTIDAGEVRVGQRVVRSGVAGAMSKAGVAVIPEDRHDSGCVLEMSVAENLFLSDPSLVSRRGVLNRQRMTSRAEQLIDQYSISCTGPDAAMQSLSGGNQQRVVLAREMAETPTVLVAAQPTRGLDVGAVEYMSEQIRKAADLGVGVLLLSTELEEILDLAHRIVVISQGRIVAQMSRDSVNLDQLGLAMGGTEQ